MGPPDPEEALNIARLARRQVITQHLTMPRLDVARAIVTGVSVTVWLAVGWLLLAERPLLQVLVAAVVQIPLSVAIVALRHADALLREARYVACRAYDFTAQYAASPPTPTPPPDVHTLLAGRRREARRRQDN